MKEEMIYFEHPTQVKFVDMDHDGEKPNWIGAIAYKDELICGCCGGTINLEEYYEDWKDFGRKNYPDLENPIVSFDYWVDVSYEIKG